MHKQKLIVSLLLFLFITSLTAFRYKANEKPEWNNIQVLPKNLNSKQMDEIMEAWSASLGVSCNHCHLEENHASDAKEEKTIARKMLTMTNEINDNYFGKNSGTVSCMTCHNGKAHP